MTPAAKALLSNKVTFLGARGEDFQVSRVPASHTLDTRCPCYAGVRIMGLVDRKPLKVRDGTRTSRTGEANDNDSKGKGKTEK